MRYWDWPTFVLYIFIGFAVVIVTYISENVGTKSFKIDNKKYNAVGWICYLYLFVLLVFFASFRYVGHTIGGIDALDYIEHFLNPYALNFSLKRIFTLNQTEPLFFMLARIVRMFTSNYVVFFIVFYSIIAYCYIKFISKQFNKKMNYMPLIYVVLPYLNSFNTMRSAMAMAIVLLCYNALTEKKEKKAIALLLVAALFHYTALIVFLFYLFYKIVSNKLFNKKRFAISFMLIFYMIFYFGGSIIANIIGNTKYYVYLEQNNSLIGQAIIIIEGGLSLLYFNNLKITLKEKRVFLWAVIFNLMMIPLMISFGFFRLNNYFVFPRLFIWSHLIRVIKEKTSSKLDSGLIVDFFAFIFALMWTIFRISRDWYPEGVMPYFNILFM